MYEQPTTTLDRTMHLIGELMAKGYDANLEHTGGTEYVATIAVDAGVWVITDEATIAWYDRAEQFTDLGLEPNWETYLPTPADYDDNDDYAHGIPAAQIAEWVSGVIFTETELPMPPVPARSIAPAIADATPVIVDVKVEPYDGPDLSVGPVWGTVEGANFDRPYVGGFVVAGQRMADRLVAAIKAGAVYPTPEIAVDSRGKTYVSASAKVLGRYMNADLKRLGF